MSFNKSILVFSISLAILSGCSSTEERSLLDDVPDVDKVARDARTRGYGDGSSLSGEEFDSYSTPIDSSTLGEEFRDPSHPLSKGVIYFMYDSSQVKQEFISVVAAHAQYLKDHPSQTVILEGHADERGSAEYNIALGEQRAKSIDRMMAQQGVSSSQMEVVSYGEEKPDTYGMDESSWQMNRRVEIIYQGK
jgi:peptidoglycan-associated lipoprotein